MGGKGSGNSTPSNPFTAKKANQVDPDTNARTINYTLALSSLPPFDRGSVEETEERVRTYFDMCIEYGMRPLVGNFCVAMGISKSEMWKLANDERSGKALGITPETLSIYKKTLCLIDSNFEQVLMDAKNPVPAIFYAKSNFGWREAPTETVVTHRTQQPQLEGGTADEIAGRYLAAVGVDEEEEQVYEEP